MNLYNRKIQYYKSFKLIDTNGDGVKDTIVYSPISTNYHLQFSLEQDIKNVDYWIQSAFNKLISYNKELYDTKINQ